MWKEDYGIILVKPDGVKIGIEYECEKLICKKGINVIAKKYVNLDCEDIKRAFYYKFDSYIKYMTEGKVCAFYIKGENMDLDVEIFKIKNMIRKKYNLNGKHMRNLVHGTHCGTELFYQRKLLFPELDTQSCSYGADMYCVINSSEDVIIDKIKNVDREKNIVYTCLDIPIDQFNTLKKKIESYKLNTEVSFSVTQRVKIKDIIVGVICYLPRHFEEWNISDIKRTMYGGAGYNFIGEIKNIDFSIGKEINTLYGYNEANERKVEDGLNMIVDSLENSGIRTDGILINSSDMDLCEAECRYEFANKFGYMISGGCKNIDNYGLFTMSYNKSIELITKIQRR